MSQFSTIPFEDIISFLITNNVITSCDKEIKVSKIDESTHHRMLTIPSVSDWLIIHKLSITSIELPIYKSSDILLSSIENLSVLATSLSLPHVDKSRIIRILSSISKLDNDMNVFDLLPFDILRIIFLELNYRTIKCVLSLIFPKLNLSELLRERECKGYPRLTGHAFTHTIPKNIVPITSCNKLNDNELTKGLDYLYGNEIDVIKGDIIVFHSLYASLNISGIFDGRKIINMEPGTECCEVSSHYGLPKMFHIIENDIPIYYWAHDREPYYISVWFNHLLVSDQCIPNIKYSKDKYDQYELFTTFNYNKNPYKIMFNYQDIIDEENIDWNTFAMINDRQIIRATEIFKKMLSSSKDIIFSVDSGIYIRHDKPDKSLYINFIEIEDIMYINNVY